MLPDNERTYSSHIHGETAVQVFLGRRRSFSPNKRHACTTVKFTKPHETRTYLLSADSMARVITATRARYPWADKTDRCRIRGVIRTIMSWFVPYLWSMKLTIRTMVSVGGATSSICCSFRYQFLTLAIYYGEYYTKNQFSTKAENVFYNCQRDEPKTTKNSHCQSYVRTHTPRPAALWHESSILRDECYG